MAICEIEIFARRLDKTAGASQSPCQWAAEGVPQRTLPAICEVEIFAYRLDKTAETSKAFPGSPPRACLWTLRAARDGVGYPLASLLRILIDVL